MKDQTNLIISIVCGVLAVGIAIACFATKREPGTPAPAPQVVTTAVKLPEATVTYTNGLPAGGGAAGGMGAMGGRSGMPGGMSGMPSGMGRPGGLGGPSMAGASSSGASSGPGIPGGPNKGMR
ncbi:hypothetical protein EON81_07710 [bacterium]|nr:MAG: hypothetical protein EON81_07710 [bacterium]